MQKHRSTLKLIGEAAEILDEQNPMTLRQLYYQLVSRQILKNRISQYKKLCRVIRDARKDGSIPWDWLEDRLRRPREVPMWNNLPEFFETVRNSYRLNVWRFQSTYIEVWLEKDALSGVFENILWDYGVTLNVGRGYDGWSSIYEAYQRLSVQNEPPEILYFGDFDPSGEDMMRSLEERLLFFYDTPDARAVFPTFTKCALTREDIERYDLPPDPAKRTDTRAAAFIAEHGDVSVELDALPVAVLRDRIRTEIESRLNMSALAECRRVQAEHEAEMHRIIAENQ